MASIRLNIQALQRQKQSGDIYKHDQKLGEKELNEIVEIEKSHLEDAKKTLVKS